MATTDEYDDLDPEYNMDELLKGGVRGKYAKQYAEGTNVVLLDSDVFQVFKTSESVNEALRLAIKIKELNTFSNTKAAD